MKKRLHLGIALILILSIFLVIVALVNKQTSRWESSEKISFNISGFDGNLSEAIAQDLFRTLITSVLDSPAPDGGHSVDEVWVSVNGNEMTFKDAIENTDLCGIASPTTSYLSVPDPSQLATEVEVTTPYDGQTKSLQDAINDGTLVNINGDWSAFGIWTDTNGCSVSCGEGIKTQQRTRSCNNPPVFCAGQDCVGSTTETRSVSCNTQTCLYSGTGCGGCPFGVESKVIIGAWTNYFCILNGYEGRYYAASMGSWSTWSTTNSIDWPDSGSLCKDKKSLWNINTQWQIR